MREISLITGQLHRAIYNLNDEARRTANQKFESGLPSAPQRSLKKAFDQFRDSLQEGDSQVRRRTAALLVTLIRSFEQIVTTLQPDILEMIDMGLADADPLVREATVESYSLLLEKIDDQSFSDQSLSDQTLTGDGPLVESGNVTDVAVDALRRILEIGITDPAEIVREAAVVAVAVQKSQTVQNAGVSFLLHHVDDQRYRCACRSIASLAEFPSLQSRYITELNGFLNDSDVRLRCAALSSALRLAKLESLPRELLPNVARRMFDSAAVVATAARIVIETALVPISRTNARVSEFLAECLWLAKQEEARLHLPAIFETDLVRENFQECHKLCCDRIGWLRQKRSLGSVPQTGVDLGIQGLLKLADDFVDLDGRSAIGWMAAAFIRTANESS